MSEAVHRKTLPSRTFHQVLLSGTQNAGMNFGVRMNEKADVLGCYLRNWEGF
jgi:hypothetical protein